MSRIKKITQPVSAGDYPIGRGSIFIPFGVDRDQFVETSLRSERVSLMLEDGRGSINDVYICKNILQQIYFPKESGELGSAVIYNTAYPNNEYTVIGVLSNNDGSQLLEEYQFKTERTSDNGRVSIIGRGKNGELIITVDGEKDESGKIILNARNKSNKAFLEFNILGRSNIYTQNESVLKSAKSIELQAINNKTDKNSSLKYENGVGLTYLDEFSNKFVANEKEVLLSINTEKEKEESESEEEPELIPMVEVKFKRDDGLSYLDKYGSNLISNEDGIILSVNDKEEGSENIDPIITTKYDKINGYSYEDKWENKITIDNEGKINVFSKNKLSIDSNLIEIGSSSLENAAKGDTLVDLLGQICDEFISLIVPTAMGPSGTPINAAKVSAIKAKLNMIKSQKTKIE